MPVPVLSDFGSIIVPPFWRESDMINKLSIAAYILAFASLLGLSVVANGDTRSASAQTQGDTTGSWTVFTIPLKAQYQTLRGVSALSGSDVWAVGSVASPDDAQTLTVHYDGRAWSVVPSPNVSTKINALGGVAAISANDVWAVGWAGDGAQGHMVALTIHWDGRAWSVVPNPAPSDNISELHAVAAVSKDDVWAVGFYTEVGTRKLLILHWDGIHWTRVLGPELPMPRPGVPVTSELNGVTAISRNDVWAVGYGTGQDFYALALHWNGSAWSVVPTPRLPNGGVLNAVSSAGANEIWAVGQAYGDQTQGDATQTLTMRWDGAGWSTMPSPNADLGNKSWNSFQAVAAISPHEAWAVGYYYRRSGISALITRWDGKAWEFASSPIELYGTDLLGATSKGDTLWVVGSKGVSIGSGPEELLLIQHVSTSFVEAVPPLTPLNPPVPVPGTGGVTFPETGKTVTGLFLDYWKTHGGLAQQGYPISDVMGEVSDLDGKLYTVQYFERAVFEYHPDNKPPYDVLLSQLGTFEYQRKYPNGAPNQRANKEPGFVFFAPTGHYLGGAFLDYWQKNGGLMQQGYPISDEFMEVSELNGKPYLVQYFERAVFEWHPEKKPPYEVLLSHLGRFRYNGKYQAPSPPLSPGISEIKQIPGGWIAAGHYTFWMTGDGPISGILGYDLDKDRSFVVTTSPTNKSHLASDGRYVVWTQDCPPYCHRIRVYDLITGVESAVFEPAGRSFNFLAVDNGTLYYHESTEGRTGLFAHSLATGADKKIADGNLGPDGTFLPVIEDGILLYSRFNASGTECTLYMRKLDGSGGETAIAQSRQFFFGYHTSAGKVVWSGYPLTPPPSPQPGSDEIAEVKVSVYDISTHTTKVVSSGASFKPVIRGNMIAWNSYVRPEAFGQVQYSLEAYDLSTGGSWTVTEGRNNGLMALGITEDGRVVFSESGLGGVGIDVYVVRLK
jgi:hypothetical protein